MDVALVNLQFAESINAAGRIEIWPIPENWAEEVGKSEFLFNVYEGFIGVTLCKKEHMGDLIASIVASYETMDNAIPCIESFVRIENTFGGLYPNQSSLRITSRVLGPFVHPLVNPADFGLADDVMIGLNQLEDAGVVYFMPAPAIWVADPNRCAHIFEHHAGYLGISACRALNVDGTINHMIAGRFLTHDHALSCSVMYQHYEEFYGGHSFEVDGVLMKCYLRDPRV